MMLNSYYPATTEEIIHKGKKGNIYRLDGIEKCISLKKAMLINPLFRIIPISYTERYSNIINTINKIHNPIILESYKTGKPIDIAEGSGIMWQPKLLNYVYEQAIVSETSVENLKSNNSSIVITGGGHHAQKDMPYGFCPVNTMALSAIKAINEGFRVAIIDLDTHYSNGCFDILKDKENIKVYSLWNQKLDKWKYFESEGNIWHRKVENCNDYFQKLDEMMKNIIEYKPNLIIYHLGLDVLEIDRMGGVLGMDYDKLYKRDKLIHNLISDTLRCKSIIFIGGSYIDRSKGEQFANEQKISATKYQIKVLEMYGKFGGLR